MKNLQKLLAIFFLLFEPVMTIDASPIQIRHKDIQLNGELNALNQTGDTIYLLVHGTWGHGKMEIISGIQSRLEELGENSLALTLSLGINNRQGFMGCSVPIVAQHGEAVEEISKWVEYLSNTWSKIILVGHSRGGNQVALYNNAAVPKQTALDKLVLIAPMTWSKVETELGYKKRFKQDLRGLLTKARTYPDDPLFAGIVNCDDIAVSAESFLSYYSITPNKNTPELLVNNHRPVLVFLGSEDGLSQNYLDQKARFKTASQVRNISIDGAGHFFRDLYLDELVESMVDWVNE